MPEYHSSIPKHWADQVSYYAQDSPDEPRVEFNVDSTRLHEQVEELRAFTDRLYDITTATPIEPHVEDGVEVYTITTLEG